MQMMRGVMYVGRFLLARMHNAHKALSIRSRRRPLSGRPRTELGGGERRRGESSAGTIRLLSSARLSVGSPPAVWLSGAELASQITAAAAAVGPAHRPLPYRRLPRRCCHGAGDCRTRWDQRKGLGRDVTSPDGEASSAGHLPENALPAPRVVTSLVLMERPHLLGISLRTLSPRHGS